MANNLIDWKPDGDVAGLRRDDDGEYIGGSILELFERALREGKVTVPDPIVGANVTHLHLRHMKGKFIWVLSTTRNSVCRTPRCRSMYMLEKLSLT